MKKIGVTTRFVQDSDYSIPVVGLADSYAKSIRAVGALPIYIPVEDLSLLSEASRKDVLNAWVQTIDALIISGGEDIDPQHYHQNAHEKLGKVSKVRDEFEIELFKAFLPTGKKILGVCRGHQLINVALGGSLFQDIPSCCPSELVHSTKEDKWFLEAHEVRIEEASLLEGLLGTSQCKVNSIHHQALDTVADTLHVVATSKDGVIEACESARYRNILSVQWHPETMWQEPLGASEQLEIFRWVAKSE